MDTKIIKIQGQGELFTFEEEQALQVAGDLLRRGGLVAFPTETVYGLGGDALNPESSRKIYAAKGRPSDNPLIVHIARMEDLAPVVRQVTEEAILLAQAFWPGPLTMVLTKSERVPYETTGGLDTVAVRMPSHPVARRLIACGGGYVAAPSANLSGRPSPTSAKYVIEDMDGRVDMIIDGGEGDIGLESTIVDLTVSPPQILRPGYITQDMLAEVLGQVSVDQTILTSDSGQAPRAPGMKYRHYAPQGELMIISGPAGMVTDYINIHAADDRNQGHKVGVIGTDEVLPEYRADMVRSLGSRQDEESIARHLYSILREFDDEQVTRIYSECFETTGLGQAIMNRLLKAAGHKLIVLEDQADGENGRIF
ncbi:MAG: threonylcarbamoyl-AMP synthase [Acetatifactor sp.]|nr:threonylcarbamoyl-AMP synthase [Acetatifactor sp.]